MDSFIRIVALFQKGGPVMYLLLVCSIVVMAVAIERFRYFRTAQGSGKIDFADLEGKLKAGEFPKPVRMGTRCTRWKAADVRAWIQAKQSSEA